MFRLDELISNPEGWVFGHDPSANVLQPYSSFHDVNDDGVLVGWADYNGVRTAFAGIPHIE